MAVPNISSMCRACAHNWTSSQRSRLGVSAGILRACHRFFTAVCRSSTRRLRSQRGRHDPTDVSTDATKPSGVGNVACVVVLNFRHNDGSNQMGNLTASGVPYADYTGYVPVNPPSTVPVDPATVVKVN